MTIKKYRLTVNILLIALLSSGIIVTTQAQERKVKGRISDRNSPQLALPNVMVINLRTQLGVFAEGNNSFEITELPGDTLVVTATGYTLTKFCLKDSVYAENKIFNIQLDRLSVQLREVVVFLPRDFDKIESDLKHLGYKESDYKLQGLSAFNSPVTALYEAFSRRERSRRKVAELENADMRRGLLKELLQIYVNTKLIELDYHEYDAFIDFLRLDDETLNSITQYELALYIKEMYQHWRR